MTPKQSVRNFAGFCGYELFWGLGMPLTLWTTIMPAYINHIGGPLWLTAVIAQSVSFTGFLADPVVMKWLAWRARRLGLMTGFAAVAMFFYLALGILALSPSITGTLLVVLSACLILGRHVVGSLSSPLYYGMMMEVIPLAWRGRLMGVRGVILSLTGLAGAALSRRLLGLNGIRGYAACFLTAIGFYMIALLVLRLLIIEEPVPRRNHPHALSLRVQLRHLLQLRLFRRWLSAHVGIVAGLSSVGLITACYQDRTTTAQAVGGFTILFMLGRLTVAPLAGWLTDRMGCKVFALIHAACYIAACGVTLATTGKQWAVPTFFLLGMGAALGELWTTNYLTELLPDENRVGLLSASRWFAGPAALGTALLFGGLAGRYGYVPALALPALAASASFAVIALALPEPRRAGKVVAGRS